MAQLVRFDTCVLRERAHWGCIGIYLFTVFDHLDHSYCSASIADEKISNISSKYRQFTKCHKIIQIPPDIVCVSCTKTFYPSPSLHKINLKIETNIAEMLKSLQLHAGNADIIDLCSSCYNKLKLSIIPVQTLLNNMCVPQSPDLLKLLNTAEQRLISPVHAFLKLMYNQQYTDK